MADFTWSDLKKAAEDAGFVVVPKGLYNAVISKSEAKKTSQGKDQIKVVFKILDGPLAGKPVNSQFVISPENPTALGFFFRHMKAMGLDGSYFATLAPGAVGMNKLANDLIGRSCQIDVVIDEWQGEDRNKVNGIKPLVGTVGMAAATMAGMPQPQVMAQPQPQLMMKPQPQPVPQPAPKPVKDVVVDAEIIEDEAPGSKITQLLSEATDTVGTVADVLPSDIKAPPGLPF